MKYSNSKSFPVLRLLNLNSARIQTRTKSMFPSQNFLHDNYFIQEKLLACVQLMLQIFYIYSNVPSRRKKNDLFISQWGTSLWDRLQSLFIEMKTLVGNYPIWNKLSTWSLPDNFSIPQILIGNIEIYWLDCKGEVIRFHISYLQKSGASKFKVLVKNQWRAVDVAKRISSFVLSSEQDFLGLYFGLFYLVSSDRLQKIHVDHATIWGRSDSQCSLRRRLPLLSL